MSNTSTERMDMIADDLADDGYFTRGASVYSLTRERDFLRDLLKRIAYVARGHDAQKSGIGQEIQGIIAEYDRELRCGNQAEK